VRRFQSRRSTSILCAQAALASEANLPDDVLRKEPAGRRDCRDRIIAICSPGFQGVAHSATRRLEDPVYCWSAGTAKGRGPTAAGHITRGPVRCIPSPATGLSVFRDAKRFWRQATAQLYTRSQKKTCGRIPVTFMDIGRNRSLAATAHRGSLGRDMAVGLRFLHPVPLICMKYGGRRH